MARHSLFVFTIASLISAAPFSLGQQQQKSKTLEVTDLPPTEVPEVIKKLEEFQAIYANYRREMLQTYIERFRAAAGSEQTAISFYAACARAVAARSANDDSERGKARTPAEERKRLAELGGDGDGDSGGNGGQGRGKGKGNRKEPEPPTEQPGIAGIGACLQLQLEYLIFTLEAGELQDKSVIPSKLKDFAERAVQLTTKYLPPVHDGDTSKFSDRQLEELEARKQMHQRAASEFKKVLQQDVYGSVFAVAGGVATHFKRNADWPSSPLALNTMFESQILPPLRKSQPDILAPAWDGYIALEASLQRSMSDDTTYSKWMVNDMKDLEYQKWRDILIYSPGRDIGMNGLVALCKNNPQHQKLGNWLQELATLQTDLEEMQEKQTPAPDPAPAATK
jgi:hypothetical protein